MTYDENCLKQKGFTKQPNGTWSKADRPAGASGLPRPKSKYPAVLEPLATPQAQAGSAARRLVRVISYRSRLLDEDNLGASGKYSIDAIRRAGLIRNDNPANASIQFEQIKCKRCQEGTVIEIWE